VCVDKGGDARCDKLSVHGRGEREREREREGGGESERESEKHIGLSTPTSVFRANTLYNSYGADNLGDMGVRMGKRERERERERS